MKIKKTIVTTIERTIKKHKKYNVYVDTTNENEPNYVDDLAFCDNPLDQIAAIYWLPYNWNDVAKSKTDPQIKLVEVTVTALKQADRNERKEFYDTIVQPIINKEYFDKPLLESMMLDEIIDEYAGEFELFVHLDQLQPLIHKYTNYSLYPVYVYTHSDSTFKLIDRFDESSTKEQAFIIINNDNATKNELKVAIDNFTDYFNGSVFEFKAYDTLQDAINDTNIEALTVFANELTDFINNLTDVE